MKLLVIFLRIIVPVFFVVQCAFSLDRHVGSGQAYSTIQDAVNASSSGDRILIYPGIYRETVTVTADNLTFENAGSGEVIVTGTEVVAGWTQYSGNIYKASVSSLLVNIDEFQVFANGDTLFEARWPNAGSSYSLDNLLEFNTAVMDAETSRTQIVDAALPNYDFTGGQVWVSSYKRWFDWTGTINSYTSGRLNITDNSDPADNHVAQAGGLYYIFGVLDALDSAGEWFYDESAGELYVWVPGGGSPGAAVEVKQRSYAFDISGRDNVTFLGKNRNFSIHASNILFDDNSTNNTLDGINIVFGQYSNKAESRYVSQLVSGLVLDGVGHVVRNCEISYNSGTGVYLLGESHKLINNYIHDHNTIGTYASPIIFDTRGTVVSHNTVSRAGRSLVGKGSAEFGFYDCLLQYNDFGNAGYLTSDLGMIYMNTVDGGGSEVRYNWMHDNFADEHQNGLYFDHGCKNILIHHNAIWGIDYRPLINNMHSNYLLWFNNTGNTSGDEALWSQWEAGMAQDNHGTKWINNVVTGDIGLEGTNNSQLYNNTSGYAGLVDDKFLTAGTGPVDGGAFIDGITDNYVGAAPDRGAYELGATAWTVGHDFSSPPSSVDEVRSAPLQRNVLENASFGGRLTDLDPWISVGSNVSLYNHGGSTSQWIVDAPVLCGRYSAELGSGENEIQQIVTGLEPNSVYQLMGKLRVDAGETAYIGVDYDEADITSTDVSNTNSLWVKSVVTFVTDFDDTSVTVFARKNSNGSGIVYVEDMGLQYMGPSVSSLSEVFAVSFDNGFGNWTAVHGTPTASSSQSVTGANSYFPDQDKDEISASLGAALDGIVTVMFYDDASDTSMRTRAVVSDGAGGRFGVGVDTQTASGEYALLDGLTWSSSGVSRTTGWHEFKWDASSGTDCKVYIDGALVATTTTVGAVKTIFLGDNSNGHTGNVFFDDVSVLAYEFRESFESGGSTSVFYDDFESGFGNWTTNFGTPSTTTAQADSGTYSYFPNEDKDEIYSTLTTAVDGVVSVMFYDDASDTSMRTRSVVQGSSGRFGVGVDTPTTTGQYALLDGLVWSSSGVSRTTGWHEFKWDASSGTDCKVYVDGSLVATTTTITDVKTIYLGDNSNNMMGAVYFDSVEVKTAATGSFAGWTSISGTASASSAQATDGSYSFHVNEDRDEIDRQVSSGSSAVARVMFYDDLSNGSMRTRAVAVGSSGNRILLGVDNNTATSFYSFGVNGAWTESVVPRSTGWHELTFDLSSGYECRLYVDGKIVGVTRTLSDIDRIQLGDNSTGSTGESFFDDVLIVE